MARKHLFAAALLIGLAAPAGAATEDRMYASVLAQYVLFDDARALENGFGGQLGFGIPLTDSISVELNYFTRSSDIRGGGSFDQSAYGVDGLYFFDHDGALDLYFVLGLGTQTDDDGAASQDYSAVSAGLGVVDSIDDNFAFRAELRAYRGEDVGTSTDIALSVGIVYYFGEPARQMAPAMAPAAVPKDSDGDGVLDSDDRCAGTALGSKVDGTGCLVAVAAAAAVVDGDADADGVKDSVDKCPTTPAGEAVMANGCPLDSDHDGVNDAQDKCPGTPAGTKVLASGCEVPKVVKLEGVTFETNSDKITASSKGKLDEAVAALKANPTIAVEVAGHTDSTGKADANRALSQKRADAVRKYLVDAGVAATQVSAKGYGPDEPVASNDDEAGRAQNRRVELRIKQ